MAIDTENKRRSALSKIWYKFFPVPDGTIDTGDRRQAAGYYRGIVTAAPATIVVSIVDVSLSAHTRISEGSIDNVNIAVEATYG